MEPTSNFYQRIYSSRIKYLYEQSVSTILYNIVLLTVANVALWNTLSLQILIYGWIIIISVALARYFYARYVLRTTSWGQLPIKRKLFYIYMFLSLLGGLAWGWIFILYANQLTLTGQLFMLLLLGGVCAAAVAPLSSFVQVYLIYTIPMLLAPIIFFGMSSAPGSMATASVTALYLVVQIAATYRNNRLTCRGLRLQIEKDDLIETLSEKNKRINVLLQIDELTQIPNRRYLFEMLEKEFHRAQRESSYLTLFMCDIDYFKDYNDHYGHMMGDKVLHDVAQILYKTLQRSGDFVARYGGEEFFAILPNTNRIAAVTMAERILTNIRLAQIDHVKSSAMPYLTLSIGGIVLQPTQLSSIDDLISQADRALYVAKNKGRNCFIIQP
jgi:diguanylate cyclase (GGDEF)-like protein